MKENTVKMPREEEGGLRSPHSHPIGFNLRIWGAYMSIWSRLIGLCRMDQGWGPCTIIDLGSSQNAENKIQGGEHFATAVSDIP